MEKFSLKTELRTIEENPNKLRAEGFLLAELYGHNVQNIHLKLNQNEFEKLYRKAGESTLIELEIPNTKTQTVLVHDVQRHFLTSKPIHVDFFAVNMTEKLTTHVSLEFTGESLAVKALGGTLVKILDSVEVECLPKDLPQHIEIDITPLATFVDQIKVSDLKVPHGVEILTSLDEVIAKVQEPRNIEEDLSVPVVEDVSAVEMVEKEAPEAEASESD